MAKKKRKRAQQPPESPVSRFFQQNQKWFRRLAITAGLVGVLAAIWFIADPFGGTPTAIDENGLEVRAGLVDRVGGDGGRDLAANFLLPDYDQQAVRLEDFEGKVVFLNFWASWCGPCEREMPSIIRIAEQFPDDVVVLAVNRGESKGTATNWTRTRNFREDLPNFLWLLDSREIVYREYRQGNGMPQSYFIDPAGVVRSGIPRALEFDEMVASVERALAFRTTIDAE